MTDSNDMVKLFRACVKVETDKAYLVHVSIYPGERIEVWFPKSHTDIDEVNDVWVGRWLIDKKSEELDEHIMLDPKFE